MQDRGIVQEKSLKFAVRIVNVCKYLKKEYHEYSLFEQMLRSGTSIGANIYEAEYGISRNDFLAKMYIAYKECSETIFWLRLLHETKYLTDAQYQSLSKDCLELHRLLAAITMKLQKNKEHS